ncbi:hypothetical protein B0O99DRAFT_611335 [Bisporella sp. PMI_857]|nr:hypothetical protein B0O99DRAFT_611335 [Bisporella sp. PMI_857]
MMADRLAVLRRRTLNARALIGFVEMDKTELEQDTQCPICLMDMNEDTPIQLIICCKQVLGAECLKHWLREVVPGIGAFRQNCPHCRAQFPDFFVQKLFGREQYIQRYFAHGHVQVENQLEGGLLGEANGTPVPLWSLTVENEHVGMEE